MSKAMQFAQSVLAKEFWTPTPLLKAETISARLGVDLWLKREDCTPIGSFKLRGALVTVESRIRELTDRGVYVASAGNYGIAIAYACYQQGVPVTVVVPKGATESKVNRIQLCGAEIIQYGDDFDAAKEFAKSLACGASAEFWEDGVVEEMANGAASIGMELTGSGMAWDYVIVPVGNGSLIKGVAQAMKTVSPSTRIIGVVPSGAPAMAYAIRGEVWDPSVLTESVADGLAVRVPILSIVEEIRESINDVWIVDETEILQATRSLFELEQVLSEPSGAAWLPGLVTHQRELASKRVAGIITGAHLKPSIMQNLLALDGLL